MPAHFNYRRRKVCKECRGVTLLFFAKAEKHPTNGEQWETFALVWSVMEMIRSIKWLILMVLGCLTKCGCKYGNTIIQVAKFENTRTVADKEFLTTITYCTNVNCVCPI